MNSRKEYRTREVISITAAFVITFLSNSFLNIAVSNFQPEIITEKNEILPEIASYICACKEKNENVIEPESESYNKEIASDIVSLELPSISTKVKLFTDYRVYNLWYTPHYRLQQAAWTDEQGLRRFKNDYIVALGSYYSTDIGDRFEITLDSGRMFTVIMGDGKWDADCDERKMYTPCIDYGGEPAANVLEFVVDKNILDDEVYKYGSLERLNGFEGNITKMEYLGRDNSQDWDLYETK